MTKDFIDHIAVEVKDIDAAVKWYSQKFNCKIKYQDNTWAMLSFQNISIALVTPGEHPAHFAIVKESLNKDENIKYHRDGIGYIYSNDIDNNVIELVDRRS